MLPVLPDKYPGAFTPNADDAGLEHALVRDDVLLAVVLDVGDEHADLLDDAAAVVYPDFVTDTVWLRQNEVQACPAAARSFQNARPLKNTSPKA